MQCMVTNLTFWRLKCKVLITQRPFGYIVGGSVFSTNRKVASKYLRFSFCVYTFSVWLIALPLLILLE